MPIIPDEARTFGMEGMFRQLGIYSSKGQRYVPQDAAQIMFYKEDKKGQIMEEGINEAGAMSAWIAAATSYSTNNCPVIPFYIFYSMFGFQRVGDLAWAAGDAQARGFLIGATAGRTTLNGEGLQHQDGHSHLLASTIPNCRSYDPAYAYELAVIIQHGLKAMFEDKENCYYYITVMNENYAHPAMPDNSEEGIIRGIYLLQEGENAGKRVQLMGSGSILNEVLAAAEILAEKYGISTDIWSLTSINQLARDGQDTLRHAGHGPARGGHHRRQKDQAARAHRCPGWATDHRENRSRETRVAEHRAGWEQRPCGGQAQAAADVPQARHRAATPGRQAIPQATAHRYRGSVGRVANRDVGARPQADAAA